MTALVFLVALSEYDQMLYEDESVNRMQEALTLFDSICNSRWFIKTSIVSARSLTFESVVPGISPHQICADNPALVKDPVPEQGGKFPHVSEFYSPSLQIDLFADKIKHSPLEDFFSDYTGGDNYDAACDYLLHRFVSLNQAASTKQIYAHYTCATDTQQIKCEFFVLTSCRNSLSVVVLSAIQDILLQLHLRECGLL